MQIDIKGIAKRFSKKRVLTDVTFSAKSGECIGILGGNGCGKSTLLSILAGVQSCQTGEFLCDGRDLFKRGIDRSSVVGYIPQGTPLIEELTAWDNLSLWYEKDALRTELESGVLHLLGIHEFIKTPVSKMSGGMKKRLSIGCAIAKHPPVLLLDEPMAALDLACKQEISAYLRAHKKAGGILLLVTHDVMELELCDRCYILKDGALQPFVYDGDLDNLVKSLS